MMLSLYNDFNYSGMDVNLGPATIWFVVAMLIFSLLYIAYRILLGIATYNDANSKGNTESAMWGVLVGVFGWIPGIIYLCIRNSNCNRLIICQNCGYTHRIAEPNCPQCNVVNPFSQQFTNPLTQIQKRRAKKMLIAAIIVAVVAIILLTCSILCFVFSIVNTTGFHINYQ